MREKENSYRGFSDFGEVLRHELINPLTGILGNAELLLVELQRSPTPTPEQLRPRLETIAALAVRMRETVRWLSEDWKTHALGVVEQSSETHQETCR